MARAADGSGSEETLLPPQNVTMLLLGSWSPDGKSLTYSQLGRNGKREGWILFLEGERKPQLLLSNQFDNGAGSFSPDGKYLAYVSNETGRNEVYVMRFGGGNGKWQISTGGGNAPVWERDGKQLFYRESGNIMGVDVAVVPAKTANKYPCAHALRRAFNTPCVFCRKPHSFLRYWSAWDRLRNHANAPSLTEFREISILAVDREQGKSHPLARHSITA